MHKHCMIVPWSQWRCWIECILLLYIPQGKENFVFNKFLLFFILKSFVILLFSIRLENWMGNCSLLHCNCNQKYPYKTYGFCSSTFPGSRFDCTNEYSRILQKIEKCRMSLYVKTFLHFIVIFQGNW